MECQRLFHQKQQYARALQRAQLQLTKKSQLPDPQPAQPTQSTQSSELSQKLSQQQQQIQNLLVDLNTIHEQNKKLREQLENSERIKNVQIAATIKNYEDKLGRAQARSYKELGAGFQVKINQLLDENYGLKNKITSLQSQIQTQRVQIQSLTSTIQAYQIRDRQTGKTTNQLQLQNLRQKLLQLQQQKDKLQSDHQFQIMKLQNMIDELKQNNSPKNDNKSFNQILKDQINQIQNLKEKLREKNQTINKMRR